MKSAFLVLSILSAGPAITAQGVFNNQTNNILIKVVEDYPSRFKNIKGELLSAGPVQAEYKSTIAVPGSLSSTIIQSGTANKPAVGWQSVLFSASDFNTARDKFEVFFNQIRNTIIKTEEGKAVIVNGLYLQPAADKTFTTIQFDLLPASGSMQKVNIDLSLRNTGRQWKIMLSVYDKDMKDAEALTVK